MNLGSCNHMRRGRHVGWTVVQDKIDTTHQWTAKMEQMSEGGGLGIIAP